MKPIISLIVPVYNSEEFLEECIESILNQTYIDFELLLINDGSIDNSGSICDSFSLKDNRIKVYHKTNHGVSAARNLGLEKALGTWVVFIDSDDFVLPTYLADFNISESNEDIIIQGLQYFNSKEKKYLNQIKYKNASSIKETSSEIIISNKLLRSGYPVAKAFKMAIIRKWNIKFNESISFHEDHVFVFDYLLHILSIKTVSVVSYKYRIFHNENSLSRKKHLLNNQLKSSELMLKGFYLLKDKFNINNIFYQKEILTLCIEPKIDAIFSLYSDRNSFYTDRKKAMNRIINNKIKFKNEYYPVIFRYKLIKLAICYLPFYLSDIFFRFVNIYQNRI
jgi:glycosyltransferase involved in cell wall biosynthesis